MSLFPTYTKNRGRVTAAVVALGLTFALAACSGGSAPEESPASGSEASEAGAAEPAAARDGELKVAVQAPPASLDPAELSEGQQAYIWGSVYDTLLMVDNDNVPQPNAAESWEWSEDGKTLTLHLRDGLTFSDGDPVTAKDVVATLERTRTTPGQQMSKLVSVTGITAPDDKTVVIELSQPEPSMLSFLAQGTGVIAKESNLAEEGIKLRPVESGPYRFSDSTVDGSSYVLERRDDYWNAEAYPFEKVTVKVIQDQTATFNAIQAGEINAGIVQEEHRVPAESAGFTVVDVPATAALVLVLADRAGTKTPALADLKVRQAINMAFDRDMYTKQLFNGNAEPTVQVFNPAGEAYNTEMKDYYTYDPEKAKELIAEAGYPDGFTLTLPSTIISQANEPTITQSLADIGITTEWVPVPPQNTAASIASAEYPAVIWFQGMGDASREVNDWYAPGSFLNPFQWESPEMTELLNAAQNELDAGKRAEIYQEISAYATENALNAPIVYIGSTWATRDGVEFLPRQSILPTVRTFAYNPSAE